MQQHQRNLFEQLQAISMPWAQLQPISTSRAQHTFLVNHCTFCTVVDCNQQLCAHMWFLAMQIVSGSRDKTIKLWNTLGECKYTIGEPDGHTEWVSCVRFSPVTNNPIIVSAGWDKLVKVLQNPQRCLSSSSLMMCLFT